jgi:hypothetical protein
MSPFHIFLSYSDFYLIIVGVEGYCCTWSHSLTHTHTHIHTLCRTPMNEERLSQRPLTDSIQHSQEAPSGIRTQSHNKRTAADLRLIRFGPLGLAIPHIRALFVELKSWLFSIYAKTSRAVSSLRVDQLQLCTHFNIQPSVLYAK